MKLLRCGIFSGRSAKLLTVSPASSIQFSFYLFIHHSNASHKLCILLFFISYSFSSSSSSSSSSSFFGVLVCMFLSFYAVDFFFISFGVFFRLKKFMFMFQILCAFSFHLFYGTFFTLLYL